MKKVMFSAIAMIACVGSSMANDIAEVKNSSTEYQLIQNSLKLDCDKVARDVWWSWWSNGASAATADIKKAQAKKECEAEKKASIQP